jgi:hypothetical protein
MAMDSSDALFSIGRILFFILIYAASTAWRNADQEAPRRQRRPRSGAFSVARRVNTLRNETPQRRDGAPQPSPFPRSDPMWDRELDSWPYAS